MPGGTPWKAGPSFIGTTAADVAGVNPAANTYRKIYHIHVANVVASTRTLEIFLGATGGSAAGTEEVDVTLAANAVADYYYPSGLRIATTDFLSARAGTDATSLVITVTGESFVL